MQMLWRKNLSLGIILLIFLAILLVACGGKSAAKVTETEAESLVLQDLVEDRNKDINEIEIKSISNSAGKYIVEWVVDEACEFGKVTVDVQTGELLEAEETLC